MLGSHIFSRNCLDWQTADPSLHMHAVVFVCSVAENGHLLKWVSNVRCSGTARKSIGTVVFSFFNLTGCLLSYGNFTNRLSNQGNVCAWLCVYSLTSLSQKRHIENLPGSASLCLSLTGSRCGSIDQLPGDRSYWLWLIQLFKFEPWI